MNSGSIPVCRRETTHWALFYSSQSCTHRAIVASAPPGARGFALASWLPSLLHLGDALAGHLTVHPHPMLPITVTLLVIPGPLVLWLFPLYSQWKHRSSSQRIPGSRTHSTVCLCPCRCVYPCTHMNTCLSSHKSPLRN